MDVKHIIFDIDGTLIDTRYAALKSLQDTLYEMKGKRHDIEDLAFAFGIPGAVTLQQLGVEDVELGNKLWNKHMHQYKQQMKCFDGIRDLLDSLCAEGYELGIITSKTTQEYIDDFLPFGLEGYFDLALCVEDCPRPKPYAEPILEYIKRKHCQPEECIYIGDAIYDSQCAANAGIKFGLALWGKTDKQHIDADFVFEKPEDLLLAL